MNAAVIAGDPIAEYAAARNAAKREEEDYAARESELKREMAVKLQPLLKARMNARAEMARSRRAARAWLKQQPPEVRAEVRKGFVRNPNLELECCVFAGLDMPSPENGMNTVFTCPLHSDAKGAKRGTGRLGSDWTGD